MPGVQIDVTDQLPENVSAAARFGPGFITVLVRAGMSQAESLTAIEDVWQGIRECYGLPRIKAVEAG